MNWNATGYAPTVIIIDKGDNGFSCILYIPAEKYNPKFNILKFNISQKLHGVEK
jgi:hypothetical protein